mmetsp:Transcript_15183/g.28542  ORF Transcript_15183/g.28542 Transcript_15183/m.28542 type:complete len:446 (-) Transcript_15183:368-1705(-)
MYKKQKTSDSPSPVDKDISSDNTDIQQQQQPSSASLLLRPRIWFILVDSDTGQSYKGTSADCVLLPPNAVTDQFRDAVKMKYDYPGYLKDFPSSTLRVYKNMASFDKRNDNANDPEEGKPLEEDSFMDGLGKSKKEALVVVVPAPIPSSKFEHCQQEFYNNIYSATESDVWLSFGQHKMPPTNLSRLYIRESYRTIACNIKSGSNGMDKVIITGTPGIGKSLFLFYLLWKMVVKEGKRVLMVYHPLNIYYDGKGGVFEIKNGQFPYNGDISFWNDSLWCLFDAKGKNEANLNELPCEFCNFILLTPPRRDMVNDFKKPPVPQYFYMPPWTESELETISSLFPQITTTEWHDRFEILGGIPRYIFEDTTKDPTQILEEACANCSLDECMMEIGLDSILSKQCERVIHSLIHMTSSPPFTEHSVCYASQTVMRIIVEKKGLSILNVK